MIVPITIQGSHLNGRSYRIEREYLPDIGDEFQDDGDIILIQRRIWNLFGGVVLCCKTVKRSMFNPG